MDVQTSFIPKLRSDTQARIERADTVSIFTVLSTIIFFPNYCSWWWNIFLATISQNTSTRSRSDSYKRRK